MAETDPSFFWNELLTSDPQRAMAFYGDTLGWRFEAYEAMEGYWVIMGAEGPVGGLALTPAPVMQAASGNPNDRWVGYVRVPDVEPAVQRMEQAGARVLRPAYDVEGVGRAALLLDGGGAPLGLITPKQ